VASVLGLDQIPRLYGFTFIGDPSDRIIYISAGTPIDAAYQEAETLETRNLLASYAIAIVTLIAAWFGSEFFILRKLDLLIKAARKLGSGDLSTRTGITYTPGEISQLAQTFDRMVAALEQREIELRESEARYSNVLSIAADAILVVDQDQKIQLFNQGAERIFGYQAAEAIGQPLDLLIPARLLETHREHLRRFAYETAAARQMGEDRQVAGLRKDGSEFPAGASISKAMMKGALTFTVILRDIPKSSVPSRKSCA